jgi:23S rRNA (guanosine2251-2'-O)-methyltransferase
MKKFQKEQRSQKSDDVILYGRHAVTAALKNPNRKIKTLVCTPETVEQWRPLAGTTPIRTAEKKEIDRLAGTDAVHQGIAAVAKPLENLPLDELCLQTLTKDKAVVLILDQVTDPQNIGAIIRSAAAFGASAVIVQDKNSPAESGSMAKAAAGTMELVPTVRVANLSRAIEVLKKNGFWVVGMDGYAQKTIDQLDKGGKTAVVMGSEGSGMRRLVEENCDMTVRLPIAPEVESLNVSTAAAIVLYELAACRK